MKDGKARYRTVACRQCLVLKVRDDTNLSPTDADPRGSSGCDLISNALLQYVSPQQQPQSWITTHP